MSPHSVNNTYVADDALTVRPVGHFQRTQRRSTPSRRWRSPLVALRPCHGRAASNGLISSTSRRNNFPVRDIDDGLSRLRGGRIPLPASGERAAIRQRSVRFVPGKAMRLSLVEDYPTVLYARWRGRKWTPSAPGCRDEVPSRGHAILRV